ncbi:hypothetical protein LGM42_16430 [Burkholderia sp. AU39826]|uniref:hypothetical protein n=1 Tax=Burkholderia sp. AU39826 TaxID=2879634 RepID=UPI001CF43218|nr:hypothetical protein [Burkholderia sp. AU39826]MCA7971456.1 hypothetical protein [Burkholderia sp. AU39826]
MAIIRRPQNGKFYRGLLADGKRKDLAAGITRRWSGGVAGSVGWKGRIAEQWDNEKEVATMRLLVGGDLQFFVDFEHSFNAPVKKWIEAQLANGQLKALRTHWTDVKLPDQATARALMLAERERSAKIRQEGYARRAVADAGKQSTDEQVP